MSNVWEFEVVDLPHKSIFDKYLEQENLLLGDISFTNCYMWKAARFIGVKEISSTLVILTKYCDKEPYIFYPIGGDKQARLDVIKELKDRFGSIEIKSLTSEQKDELSEMYDTSHFISNRDKADYIYDVKELIELNGRKFHNKKNFLNRFLEEYYGYTYESIDDKNISDIRDANNKWYDMLIEKSDGLKSENIGINRAFDNFSALNLKGGALRYDKDIIAFSFGEVIPQKDTKQKNIKNALIHIEKADFRVKGAYQAINQMLLKNEFSDCLLANREEDLGIEGLRKAKLSYNPIMLLEKYEGKI